MRQLLFTLLLIIPTTTLAHGGPSGGHNNGQGNVGSAEIFATMPAGYEWPEGVVVDYDRELLYVTGPAAAPTAGLPASWVRVYDLNDGDLIDTLEADGENILFEHAFSESALDADGNLYVNSTQLGVVKFSIVDTCFGPTWTQSLHTSTPFPQLIEVPPIPGLPPSIPNGIVVGPAGELYVTDSIQGIIFMVPPGGGEPVPVIVDPLLGFFGGGRLGMNGIKLDPEREYLYFAFTGGVPFPGAPGATGKIYRVPLSDLGETPEIVYEYGLNDLPDGLTFAQNGDLYAVLAGDNSVSVISGLNECDFDPYEIDRITEPENVNISFVQPSTIALHPDKKRAYVVNHAVDDVLVGAPVPDPSPFVIFEIRVDDRGDPLP